MNRLVEEKRAERETVQRAYERLSELFVDKGISSSYFADLSLLYRHSFASLTASMCRLSKTEEVSSE